MHFDTIVVVTSLVPRKEGGCVGLWSVLKRANRIIFKTQAGNVGAWQDDLDAVFCLCQVSGRFT